jgi:hypothetical protein
MSANSASAITKETITCGGSFPSERLACLPVTAIASSTASRGTDEASTPSEIRSLARPPAATSAFWVTRRDHQRPRGDHPGTARRNPRSTYAKWHWSKAPWWARNSERITGATATPLPALRGGAVHHTEGPHRGSRRQWATRTSPIWEVPVPVQSATALMIPIRPRWMMPSHGCCRQRLDYLAGWGLWRGLLCTYSSRGRQPQWLRLLTRKRISDARSTSC